jgi:ketosteroid isomerase-like protein
MRGKWLILALVGLLQACGGGEGGTTGAEGSQGPQQVGVGQSELWKLEIMKADRAFNVAVNEQGPSQWSMNFSPDGLVIEEGVGAIEGQESIQAAFDDAIYSGELAGLRWNPNSAEVSLSGDLGYTVGSFAAEDVDSAGVRSKVLGLYVSIWRRQDDGTWKVEMNLRVPATEPEILSGAAPAGG